jgi:hypothetical protein
MVDQLVAEVVTYTTQTQETNSHYINRSQTRDPPAIKRLKTYALARTATGTSCRTFAVLKEITKRLIIKGSFY